MKIYIRLHNSKYVTAKHILLFQRFAGISFSIMNTLFEGSQALFSKLYKMYQSLEILFFRTNFQRAHQVAWLRSRSADLLKLNFMIRCDN